MLLFRRVELFSSYNPNPNPNPNPLLSSNSTSSCAIQRISDLKVSVMNMLKPYLAPNPIPNPDSLALPYPIPIVDCKIYGVYSEIARVLLDFGALLKWGTKVLLDVDGITVRDPRILMFHDTEKFISKCLDEYKVTDDVSGKNECVMVYKKSKKKSRKNKRK